VEVTRRVSEFIARMACSDIPEPALAAARRALLDTLGVALAGSKEPTAQIIAEYVRKIGGKPIATIFRAGLKASAADAALANGTIAHALDYDDNAMPMRAHASAVLIPTILALAEQEKSSGKEILAAYVIGREVGGKIGDALGAEHWIEGWHSTATVGVMASAAAASKILRLDTQKCAIALALAASQAGGLKAQFGTMAKPFHAGMAARNGVTAAMLADSGFTASEHILEDPFGYFKVLGKRRESDYAHIPQTLANPWDILANGVLVKPSPGVWYTAVDALSRLVEAHSFSPSQVKKIEARLSARFLQGHRSDSLILPETALEGRFSLEFNLAIALLEGQAGLAQFTDRKVQSASARELMGKIGVTGIEVKPTDPELLTVTLRDGREYTERLTAAVGSLANPISDEGLEGKYRDCARFIGLDEKDIERSLRLIGSFERLADIAELMDLLA
jgi:2-methylcitrate dehydratase PrpD